MYMGVEEALKDDLTRRDVRIDSVRGKVEGRIG